MTRWVPYGFFLIVTGVAVILWHAFNLIRPGPRGPLGFRAVSRRESLWGLIIGVLIVAAGWIGVFSCYIVRYWSP